MRRFITGQVVRGRMGGVRLGLSALAVLAAAPVLGGSITLRSAAQVDPGAPVTLGQVAELKGDDAVALADLSLAASGDELLRGASWAELGLPAIREGLERAGVNLSRVALSGRICTIRPTHQGDAAIEPAAPVMRSEPGALDLSGPATVRTEVGRAILAFLGVPPDEVRVLFDARDEALLGQAVGGRHVGVQPTTATGSERLVLRVRIAEGDRLVEDRSIRADVQVRRRVLMLRSEVRRKQIIPAGALSESVAWVPPGGAEVVSEMSEAAGAVARSRLDAGTMLRRDMLEPAIMIRRGELASVYCVSDGVQVTTTARAKSDGRLGELIELRTDHSRKTFSGRVDGRGQVVVMLDQQQVEAGAEEGE